MKDTLFGMALAFYLAFAWTALLPEADGDVFTNEVFMTDPQRRDERHHA